MVSIRKVELREADTLLSYSKKTFYDFFAHLNDPAHMEAYASVAFTPESIMEQLCNPDSAFYFAMDMVDVVGYIKLNFNDAQIEFKDKNALEIERIYVSGDYHGKGVGTQLLNFAIDIARSRQFDYVWLGVWEHNHKAKAFYERKGFELCGSHEFLLGDDRQTDLLMKIDLIAKNSW